MSVALINLLSTLSVAQPSATVPDKPADAPNDTTVQAFAEILATIFGKPLPQPQPPLQLLKEEGAQISTELKPEFQSRLDRVVERMRDEFGYEVTVVEGFRTQQRQDALYEQGRTRPGSIVTWTKSSKHSEGLAADVKIDGTYNNAVGYERLAQIAEAEGLRTLGSKDPGHIELAGSVSSIADRGSPVSDVNGVSLRQMAPRAALAAERVNIAEIAAVAEVPATAAVATVARVAEVAKPGEGRSTESMNTPTQSTALPARITEVPAIPQQSSSSNGDAKQEKPTTSKQRNQETSGQPGKPAFAPIPSIPDIPVRSIAPQSSISVPHIPSAVSNTDAVSRATKITELQEASSSQSRSQVTLKIENEDGGTDRIRLNMRGTSIDTTIAVSEVSRAEQMAQRTGELRRSLEQLGLAPQTVRITTQKDQHDQHSQHDQQQKFNHPRNKSQRNHEERQR